MLPRFDYGNAVRVIRNVRNDGTYPGLATGALLVRRGSIGYIMNVGTFLQDQLIYTVHFLEHGRIVGCREEELIDAAEPWAPSLFETREKVSTRCNLAIQGEIVVTAGIEGEVMRVLRNSGQETQYHVHFPGHVLQVPESVLEEIGAGSEKSIREAGAPR